jgi:hypothetical protein
MSRGLNASLAMDANGNFYGTAYQAGTNSSEVTPLP